MKNVKQAIIVRKDLKLRRATVASLTSQAATKFLTEFKVELKKLNGKTKFYQRLIKFLKILYIRC